MLSVCRAASEAAAQLLEGEPKVRSRDVLTTSAAAAREALARTPDQLKVLRDAGVVDAGGRGVVVILDAAETALTGQAAATGRGRTTDPAADRAPSPAPTWWTAGRRTR